MTFDPKELLKMVEEMINDPTEPKIRTILSRCYYCCFLLVKKSEGLIGLTPQIKNIHGYAFNIANAKSKRLGNIMSKLFAYRVVADYSLNQSERYDLKMSGISYNVNINKRTAEESILETKTFFENYV